MNMSRIGITRMGLSLAFTTTVLLLSLAVSRAEEFPVCKVQLDGSAGARYSCAVTSYGPKNTTTSFQAGGVPATLSFTNKVRFSLEFRRGSTNGLVSIAATGAAKEKFSCTLTNGNQIADLQFMNPQTVLADGKNVIWKKSP